MGVQLPVCRIWRSTWRPSNRGIKTSSTSKSGEWAVTCCKASSPLAATVTVNPDRLRNGARLSVMAVSSSTSKIEGFTLEEYKPGVKRDTLALRRLVAWRRHLQMALRKVAASQRHRANASAFAGFMSGALLARPILRRALGMVRCVQVQPWKENAHHESRFIFRPYQTIVPMNVAYRSSASRPSTCASVIAPVGQTRHTAASTTQTTEWPYRCSGRLGALVMVVQLVCE
jgi:hypothetical protein